MSRPLRSLVTTVLALLAVGALAAGCGEQPAGRDFGTFTDCKTLGPLSVEADPANDQRGSGSGPQGDLLAVRLARDTQHLCLEYDVRGDVKGPTLYTLVMRPGTADTPVVQLQVAVLAAVKPEIIIRDGTRIERGLSGTVGVKGPKLSLLITKAQFAHAVGSGGEALFGDFRWQARTVVSPGAHETLTDCAIRCQ